MNNYGRNGKQRNQLLPTQRSVFNYSNVDTISGYHSFFSGATAGGNIVPDNLLVLNNDTSKLLFGESFDAGLDTLYGFNCYFSNALLAEGRNTQASVGSDVLSSDLLSSAMNIRIDVSAGVSSRYILESKNYIKLNNTGRSFLEVQGAFEHQGVTTNTTTFNFRSGGFVFSQSLWNIDTFGAGVLNPSGITLDFTKIQTIVFGFNNKAQGDILCGFLVENIIYFAHRFEVNNALDNTRTLNLPFRDEIAKVGATTILRSVGLFNQNSGVSFESIMDTTSQPALILDQHLNSVVCYAVGDDSLSKRIPLSVGNRETFVDVTNANTPLFSIRAKDIFIADPNRTVFNIEQLIVHSSGANLDNACHIRVLYNATLANDSFIDIPDSDSGVEYDLSATTATGGIELFSMPIYETKFHRFQYEELQHLYMQLFSRVAIDGVAISQQTKDQVLTVVATPMSGATIPIKVAADFIGGEIA